MPPLPARPCTHAGCSALSRDGSGRCEKHPRKAWQHDNRTSSDRGYGYAWQQLRIKILARDAGLCQCPDCLGGVKRVTPATEVDHIVSKARAERMGWSREQVDAQSNLRAVNRDCHKRLTMIDQGRTPADHPRFDSSGRVIWQD